jgi:transcriptional regulator with XRE-family HTH domain
MPDDPQAVDIQVKPTTVETLSAQITPPTPGNFPALLAFFIERAGISQRTLAERTGMDGSSFSKMVSGTRKPPRGEPFYRELQKALGLSAAERQTLKRAADEAATADRPIKETKAPLSTVASAGGLRVQLLIHQDLSDLDDEEIATLKEVVRKEVELALKDFGRHREVRQKLLHSH